MINNDSNVTFYHFLPIKKLSSRRNIDGLIDSIYYLSASVLDRERLMTERRHVKLPRLAMEFRGIDFEIKLNQTNKGINMFKESHRSIKHTVHYEGTPSYSQPSITRFRRRELRLLALHLTKRVKAVIIQITIPAIAATSTVLRSSCWGSDP